jgi:hypothetical protein
MQKCQNDKYLAVISGKNLIGAEQKINQLFVFRVDESTINDDAPQFTRVGWVMLRELPEYFTQCSMKFHFANIPGSQDRTELIFANIEKIFKINWDSKVI